MVRRLSVCLTCLMTLLLPTNVVANDCSSVIAEGVVSEVGATTFVGDTTGAVDDFDTASSFCVGVGYGSGGGDNIHSFQVNQSGIWGFDAGCGFFSANTNSYDTSMHIREDTGAGCPGDIVACNGDACGSPWPSAIITFLTSGTDYFLVMEGYSAYSSGAYNVDVGQLTPPCTTNADCSDGDFCNGTETCSPQGECLTGATPCPPWQQCNVVTQACGPSPPACTAVLKGDGMCEFGFCAALNQDCVGCGKADDVTLREGAGRDLISYQFEMVGRRVVGVDVGDPYQVTAQLYTITEAGLPGSPILGTTCVFDFTIRPGGSTVDITLCEPNGGLPTGIILSPGFFGTEAFVVFRTTSAGTGSTIASGPPLVGGDMNPNTVDGIEAAFGQSIFWLEDTPGGEDWGPGAFAPPTVSDFGGLTVCTDPVGPCCTGNSCSMLSDNVCAASGGTLPLDLNTVDNQVTCGDTDCDGDGVIASLDNCPEIVNADQANADGDALGDVCDNCPDTINDDQADGDDDAFGDVCDNCPSVTNEDQANADGDAHGDVCDNCPNNANDDQSTAGDGDSHPDACDNCPNDTNDDQTDIDSDGVGDVCDNCPIDVNTNQADSDSDGVGDVCDACPLDVNKIEPGLCGCGIADAGDSDGDDVLDCVDICPGADDVVFGDCRSAIPTISTWGLVILTLLLLVGGKLFYSNKPSDSFLPR